MSLSGQPGQLLEDKIGQPSQPTRENDTSQPGQPGQPTNLKTSNLIPAYSDGKYDYFTRGDVADFFGVKVQSVHDGLSGKSKTQGDRLKQFGFEKVQTPPKQAPKATIRRKITL
ncbi:hypothetical protein [Calothrix sp. 336/3]|uniref:hypothetical protein n=1 Tax=Calothrix sp. 336/3 TaxID=1337936 RepID=UPI0004E33443|nr:hypothetical protein [Calothrix sp. 336/3]AKG24947.1 hypothetical protein IJ00_26775 [Calothrix sp. 336/3]